VSPDAPAGRFGDGGEPGSFLELLADHERLFEQFLAHQDALIDRDYGRALDQLRVLERELDEHMRGEEQLFAELFSRTGEVAGAPLQLFTGEHRHLRESLQEFERATRDLLAAPPASARPIVELLDEEALFKTFFRHHDERERNLLYPAFDRGTSAADRRAKLERFHRPPPKA
jgi:hemerythrin-like domain-containing protein